MGSDCEWGVAVDNRTSEQREGEGNREGGGLLVAVRSTDGFGDGSSAAAAIAAPHRWIVEAALATPVHRVADPIDSASEPSPAVDAAGPVPTVAASHAAPLAGSGAAASPGPSTAVPEPGGAMLFGMGLLVGSAWMLRRTR